MNRPQNKPVIDCPRSWADVAACPCRFCGLLKTIEARCRETGELRFVMDGRMHGAGFVVADPRKMFVEPAAERRFKGLGEAVRYVLHAQDRCDVLISSWPLHPVGRDFVWTSARFASPEFADDDLQRIADLLSGAEIPDVDEAMVERVVARASELWDQRN